MNVSSTDSWEPAIIVCATVVLIFAGVYVVSVACKLICAGRDLLRDRYAGGGWRPHGLDLIGVPVWLMLELVCLAGAILCVLLVAWIAYDMARSARDWWREGDRGRR